ncbi:hypothetical protein EZV62_026687 [Acer yangbiense]|uniref:Uncharacterized protein n=1 Tax=Acer yangbiense TaxID=1000413 RepID=A0A5C7GRY9_9ROSI|nr:hypothetical protein EZV62_026687 [Acer yangbiense]
MHDLVHDLAQSIMEDECVVEHIESSTGISKRTFHYASINYRFGFTFPKVVYQVETLRTFLVHSRSDGDHTPSFDFSRLRYLRVLDARLMRERRLSSSISHLKHLRYLDLSQCNFEVLPESICSLYNLQTLNLNGCEYLQKLPKHTKRLKNLRHLYLDGCKKLSKMPPEIGQITCLKTITRFIVGKKRGCHLDELKGLNLGGTLSIEHLQRVENPQDANLVEKLNLRRLSLSWENDIDLQSQEDVEKVIEALKPHLNLKQLDISGYKGDQFPSWMRDITLNNVVYIEISNCDICSQLPPCLVLLPFLRTLHLSNMSRVMYIDDHFQGGGMTRGFPSLQSLKIENLPSLQRFSREDGRKLLPRQTSLIIENGRKLLPRLTSLIIENLPSLQRFSREDGRKLLPCLTSLIIVKCPKLTSLQHLPSVEQLTVSGCNEVVLGSISNLKNLISLELSNDNLNYLPEGTLLNLTSLKTLNISGFRKLKCLPTEIGSLSSLEKLDIKCCPELESFPEQGMEGLKSLKYLTLQSCRKFTSLTEGLQHLSCLESLSLNNCPELVALPDGMKYLTSLCHLKLSGSYDLEIASKWEVLPDVLRYVPALQSMSISFYENLKSLPRWLGDLTSLQSLTISYCPKLPSLPASIQGLTMLQDLIISGCPELKKRSEKEKGEDWYSDTHGPLSTYVGNAGTEQICSGWNVAPNGAPSSSKMKSHLHHLTGATCVAAVSTPAMAVSMSSPTTGPRRRRVLVRVLHRPNHNRRRVRLLRTLRLLPRPPHLGARPILVPILSLHHHQIVNLQVSFQYLLEVLLGKAKKEEKIDITQLTKLAPQFDVLNCFETFVGH